MGKIGQLSIYIILGIMLILVIGIFFYVGKSNQESTLKHTSIQTELSAKEKEIHIFMSQCLSDISKEALFDNALQGGYFELPEEFISIGLYDIPIYSAQNLPEKVPISNQLTKLIQFKINNCITSFKEFSDGYQMNKSSENNTSVFIRNNDILIKSEFNSILNISETRRETFGIIETEIEYEYQKIIDLVKVIILSRNEEGYTCLTCILNESEKYELNSEINYMNEEIIVYNIIDKNFKNHNQTFNFRFAVKK